MSHVETLQLFAAAFVSKPFRERFVHEALKKPGKLHERVCHRIEEIFAPQYKNGTVQFNPEEPCLLLGVRQSPQETTWNQVQGQVGLGAGLLVIALSATKFYAETEGPGAEVWAGER
ncbi:hypothetical protein [Methylibium rhizosphaerae]|uniref:hypothetical protein n=1 Tax=Methylibium rhizosphaerae TaxID=2570323 RepID=UPI00112B0947|nr:hypothetical protein [Methylibium rhizosphaerae]